MLAAGGEDGDAGRELVPDYQAAQLELELVLETYRKAVDLPVTLEAAQEAVRSEAIEVPSVDGADEPDEGSRRSTRKDLN